MTINIVNNYFLIIYFFLSLCQVVSSFGLGRIIGSKNMHYKSGDLVVSPFFPAAEYCVTDSIFLRKIDDKDSQIPLTEYLSALGKFH